MMSDLYIYDKLYLFNKNPMFGIILPTLDKEWAERQVRCITS